ncbi:hypothetical protein LTR09_001757 [Extremus antarcticus]|uniref:Uncharacterized protein n=1 Tax=Extremus antarcticus TaxID=702011 RepID=A0AAJ0LWB1_9PEZI|nr:hypothetical protein LTR09_001757 [Extremus antarcticus]
MNGQKPVPHLGDILASLQTVVQSIEQPQGGPQHVSDPTYEAEEEYEEYEPKLYDPFIIPDVEPYDPTRPALPSTFTLSIRPAPAGRREKAKIHTSPKDILPPPAARKYSQTANGDLEKPQTVCWEAFPNDPLRHKLFCGHASVTKTAQPCGPTCRLLPEAESKALGKDIACYSCVIKHRREASPFMAPPKRQPTKRGAPKEESLFIPEDGVAKRQRMATQRRPSGLATSTTTAEYLDKTTRELNADLARDPSLAALAASSAGGRMRTRSTRHGGYALSAELIDNAKESSLHRELQNLKTDGSDALRYKLARKQLYGGDLESNLPDHRRLEPAEGEKPHSYGQSATRRKHVGMSSIPETDHKKIMEEEDGVTVAEEFENEQLLPRAREDFGDDDQDEEEDAGEGGSRGIRADGTYFEEDRNCICEGEVDEALQQCTECEKYFHASCMGVAKFERCNGCKNRRVANQDLADKVLQVNRIAVVKNIGDLRAFRAMRRAEEKETKDREKTDPDAMEVDEPAKRAEGVVQEDVKMSGCTKISAAGGGG